MASLPQYESYMQAGLPFWHQIRTRLILSFILLTLLPMVVVMSVILWQTRLQAQQQVLNQLESVAELKRNQISRWLQDSETILDLILMNWNRQYELPIFLADITADDTGGYRGNMLLQIEV